MRELGVEGLSEDEQFLVLRDPSTDELFRVQRTLAVSQQPTPREQPMDNQLTPREIQARIRRGESPDQIAEATGMALTSIEPFAGAVIAEREYMAQQAQRTSVRRRHVTGTGVRLGDLVDQGLREQNRSPDAATWDAFRREDGRWTVVMTSGDRSATFLYDVDGRYVLPVDDAAHALVADLPADPSSDMALADAIRESTAPGTTEPQAAEAHSDVDDDVASAPTGELELDLGLPDDIAAAEHLLDDVALLPPVSSLKEARDRRAQTALTPADEIPELIEAEHDDLDHTVEHDIAVPDTSAPTTKKRHERRRVPSWDEIMFGDRQD